MGYDHGDIRVAFHPADERPELVHVLFEEGLAVGVRAGETFADHGEEDGDSQPCHEVPERPHGSIVPRVPVALLVRQGRAVVVAGHELQPGRAFGGGDLPGDLLGGFLRVGGDGVGLDHDETHEPVGVAVDDVALKLVLEGVPALVGMGVEYPGVDARVVHLGDHELGGTFEVVEHGGEVLLDVGLALVDPGKLAHVASPLGVGQLAGVGVDEGAVVHLGAVPGAPGRLVVSCQLPMDHLHLLGPRFIARGGVPLGEGAGIAIDDQGRASAPRAFIQPSSAT